MPMMNSSISTPSSASVSIEEEGAISPIPVGPSTTPARMKPATAGSLSRFMNSPHSTAAPRTAARAVMSCVCGMCETLRWRR